MPTLSNPIQRFFWKELTREGLDLVDASRVEQLVDYVKNNAITEGGATPESGGAAIDAFETSALKTLLEDNDWRGLLTDDGVKKLETVLGIRAQVHHAGAGRDATGEVPKGTAAGSSASRIGRTVRPRDAAALFRMDYSRGRASLYENPALPEDQRAKNVLFLLQDYAKRLNEIGADGGARKALLDAFFEAPLAAVYGSKDPDDDLLHNAWEIVWGTDAEKPVSGFDIDADKKWTAYMSMDGGFVATAKKIDEYLAASGQPAKVEAFEKMSPLNWIVGETPGNTKPSSSFQESRAIKSTGVDFAVKLLDDETAVAGRSLDPAFDLKVDFYAWGNFVSLNKGRGERLVARHDEGGADLAVSVEQVGESHWKPVFKDASGAVVDPGKVTCVIVDASGEVKGDGQVSGTYSASWWGFCDRNAMMGLVTQKYGFAKPSKDVTLQVGDKDFTFSSSDIAKIVGRRLTELFPTTTFAGHRYDEEPDQVMLKDGTQLAGKIKTEIDFYRPDTVRQGDVMVMTPDMESPPRGSLLVEMQEERKPGEAPAFATGERELSVLDVKEIRRPLQTDGTLERDLATIVLNDGTELDVRLKSKVDFGRADRLSDGTLVIPNTDERPLLGDLVMTTVRGKDKRVALHEVQYATREDQNEVLAEEALSYIIRNRGVFCADSWTGSSVANGTRTIEEIRRWSVDDPNRPDWVPDDLSTLKGYRGQVEDPSKLLFFSLGNKGSMYSGLRFWIELDENGVPKNSNIMSGQWDFLWGVEGKPDWNAKATFNPHMPHDLVLKLYVNSVEDPEQMADILPEGWRDHLIPS